MKAQYKVNLTNPIVFNSPKYLSNKYSCEFDHLSMKLQQYADIFEFFIQKYYDC